MKIDELLQRKEKILHRCGMAPAARIRYSLMHAGLVFAILSLFVSSVIRLLMIEADMYSWTDGGKGCVFFCMIPVFCYLIYSIGQNQHALSRRHTDRHRQEDLCRIRTVFAYAGDMQRCGNT